MSNRCECKGGPSQCGRSHGIGRCKRTDAAPIESAESGTVNLCPACRGNQKQKKRRPVRATPARVAEDYGDDLFGRFKR